MPGAAAPRRAGPLREVSRIETVSDGGPVTSTDGPPLDRASDWPISQRANFLCFMNLHVSAQRMRPAVNAAPARMCTRLHHSRA
jgi:hypothetical protein